MPVINSTDDAAAAAPLPDMDQRPSADVVIYDGDCRICTSQIRRIQRWDPGGRLQPERFKGCQRRAA